MNKKSFSGHDIPETANLPVAPLTPDDNEFYALCGFIDDIFLLPERRERIVKLAQDNHLPIFMVVNMVEPYFALNHITEYDHSPDSFETVFKYLKTLADEEGELFESSFFINTQKNRVAMLPC